MEPGRPGTPSRPRRGIASPVAIRRGEGNGDLSLPLGLALGSPIFPSGCEGKLGVALESLQGLRDLLQSKDHSVGSKRYLSRLEKRVESFASPRDEA